MTESFLIKLSSTITNSEGEVLHRVKVKEEDFIPGWASLMIAKSMNPVILV